MYFPQFDYHSIKQENLRGRYITYDHISGILKNLSIDFKLDELGKSVLGLPIESVTFGKGPKRILMWSQMHGNESTTTKAVFDFIGFIESKSDAALSILNNCTVKIIPMLNPDGAKAYTRINANEIDLNRDAQERSQPESRVLRNCFEEFKPDFCFNLHDQRTIFNVGRTPIPATISFLAPAHDDERTISATRELSMKLIVAMNSALKQELSGQVGRYDDSFNPNCVGDTFQLLGTPTILFEAGHYPDDYDREYTRQFMFKALMTAIDRISIDAVHEYNQEAYFEIPENNKLFYDVLIRNAHLIDSEKYTEGDSIAILFKELLQNEQIVFEPTIEKIGDLHDFYGHKTYDCDNDLNLEDLKDQPYWNML
ncbi:MAG: peptidase M14 [Maribacter sp.]|nr:peptidase M14 [Maribacter sp.]